MSDIELFHKRHKNYEFYDYHEDVRNTHYLNMGYYSVLYSKLKLKACFHQCRARDTFQRALVVTVVLHTTFQSVIARELYHTYYN